MTITRHSKSVKLWIFPKLVHTGAVVRATVYSAFTEFGGWRVLSLSKVENTRAKV